MKRPVALLSSSIFVACAWLACGLPVAGTMSGGAANPDGATPQEDASGSTDGQSLVGDASTGGGPDATSDGGSAVDSGVDAGPIDPYTTRVTSSLIALYDFEEDTGATAHDKVTSPYDLTIGDTGKVTWQPHYLTLTDYTTLTGTGNFTKFINAASTANAFTVEAWVRFTGVDNQTSNAFGRLVSVADSSDNRTVDFGDQTGGGSSGGDAYMGVIGGDNSVQKGNVDGTLHHLVLVSSGANLTIFLDGSSFATINDSDQPKDNHNGVALYVANVKDGDRGVKGDLHLIAFYSAALAPNDVMTNYLAGPDPGLPHDN